jgi:hypothetical protein
MMPSTPIGPGDEITGIGIKRLYWKKITAKDLQMINALVTSACLPDFILQKRG